MKPIQILTVNLLAMALLINCAGGRKITDSGNGGKKQLDEMHEVRTELLSQGQFVGMAEATTFDEAQTAIDKADLAARAVIIQTIESYVLKTVGEVKSEIPGFPERTFVQEIQAGSEGILIGAEQILTPWVYRKNGTFEARVLVLLNPEKVQKAMLTAAGSQAEQMAETKAYKKLNEVRDNYKKFKESLSR